MEIIREGSSASRPPTLDEKNYSYWKPLPKPEVDWTDAEEQASVGNARALNAIFSGVLRSLPRKFDMKVTSIEEARDITTLKLDELFRSLLTFKIAIFDRENKKGKGIVFKSIYEEETTVNQSDNEANIDESIALLTKQFAKVWHKCLHIMHYRNGEDSECSDEDGDEDLTFEELKMLRKEDTEARAIQKERIQDLMEENERLMSFFYELKECASGHVTFGDVVRGRIIAKGNIDKNNLPCLNDVTYVDGLKANLISITKEDQTWLWHRKLGHISLGSVDKAIKNEAVKGIPTIDITSKFFCGDCQIGKQTKTSHKSLKECSTNRVLELLHLDLMGSMQTENLGGKKYVLVAVDDFSRFTWVHFLKGKSDTIKICISLCLNLQHEKGKKIIRIRSDHGKEFDNEDLNNFYGADIHSNTISKEVVADNSELVPSAHVRKNHPSSSIIGDPLAGIITRKKEKVDYSKMIADLCYTSVIEPSTVDDAFKYEYWINEMQEELL
ncbi:Peptidase aspartic, catalytic [Cucumis melo var. makuwa]|uniref:Peptidase aspartic, catalytic n=1 Tax=Cucumis melo var. makuwa TaxID=1194695 RepID=A0A5A7UR65_CUCMM|nr:Peptidase aspartic, catalytic [Cucumis melo var. makuwa]